MPVRPRVFAESDVTRRRFRLRIRPGRSIATFTSSPEKTPVSARAGEEVVVSEEVAAALLRTRAADLIEVSDASEDDLSTDCSEVHD